MRCRKFYTFASTWFMSAQEENRQNKEMSILLIYTPRYSWNITKVGDKHQSIKHSYLQRCHHFKHYDYLYVMLQVAIISFGSFIHSTQSLPINDMLLNTNYISFPISASSYTISKLSTNTSESTTED